MQKKYLVRLTDSERATLAEVVKKLKGSSQKVRRADPSEGRRRRAGLDRRQDCRVRWLSHQDRREHP